VAVYLLHREIMFTLRNPIDAFLKWLGVSDSGEPQVNEESMLGLAAVWYAINTISGDVGKMPLEPRKIEKRLNSVDINNPWYRLLRDEANRYQTSDVFKEQIQSHVLSWGNGRAFIARGNKPELLPLRPDVTDTVLVKGEKWHVTTPETDDPLMNFEELKERLTTDSLPRGTYAIPDRDVLHIQGFGYYGIEGRSVAWQFRETFGTDLSAQRYNKDALNNGMSARIMLEAPPGSIQDEEEAEAFLKAFRENYSRKNKGEVAGMLREGIKAVDVSRMSNVDAQFIEQRKFSRQDVMLIFGLQHIPGDSSATSYNSLEQKQLAYLASALSRWLTRWEMQCDMKLRTPIQKQKADVYFKFNRGTWLQMDAPATADVLTKYRQAKVMTQNECRDKLDLNPVDGGDSFENPNVSKTEGMVEPASTQPTDLKNIKTAATWLAADVLFGGLLETECVAVKKATGNKNFVSWIETKYQTFEDTYKRRASSLGVDADDYVSGLSQRKQQLLEACECQPEQLQDRVNSLVESWQC
jgi:HK97 family phage portal protein